MYNVDPGSMRHYIIVGEKSLVPDDNGEVGGFTQIFDFRCNALFKSGAQNSDFGVIINETIITVMTWYDERLQDQHILRWNGLDYEVQNIAPDEELRGMLITAKRIK